MKKKAEQERILISEPAGERCRDSFALVEQAHYHAGLADSADKAERAKAKAEAELAWEKLLQDTVSYYEVAEDTSWNCNPLPLALKHKPVKGLLLPKPFDPVLAMRSLLGGRVYVLHDSSGITGIHAFWKNEIFSPDSVPGKFDDEYVGLGQEVESVYSGSLAYSDAGGKHYLLMAVNSSESELSFIRSGRFHCGLLGLFLFAEEQAGWRLLRFDPLIGCFGQFGYFPSPELLPAGKGKSLLLMSDWLSGAGGPSWTSQSFYSIDSSGFRCLLKLDTGFGNVDFSEWDSQFTFEDQPGNTSGFLPLICSTRGYLGRHNFDEEKIRTLHPKLQEILAKEEFFSFVLVRRFDYRSGAYTETSALLQWKKESYPRKN